MGDSRPQTIRRLAGLLRDAERPVRILRRIAWPSVVKERFLASGGRELPQIEYAPLPLQQSHDLTEQVRKAATGNNAIDRWLRRSADAIEGGARMMHEVGTAAFHTRSTQLYGAPRTPLTDGVTTSLDLAHRLQATLPENVALLGPPDPLDQDATAAADRLERAAHTAFGDKAPELQIADDLAAGVVAGPRRVRVRRQSMFSDREVQQLIQHELLVHVATSLNGAAQKALPILAASHPGTTRTQEGLAVLAEFLSGAMGPRRLLRLANRVLAIQQAIDGADFRQVYEFFLGHDDDPDQAFEDARRVFRGAPLTGGAPFTKDVVYLDGLLRVHDFLRAAVSAGRVDCVTMLFAGKLDVEDVPALCELHALGLLERPTHLPPWAEDRRFLLCYLAWASFQDRIDFPKVREHYDALLREAPLTTAE